MDTENLAAEVETELYKEYGIEITLEEFNQRFAGTSSEHVMKTMMEEHGRAFPDNHLKDVEQRLNEKLWREAKGMPGVHEMLDNLDQPRCICSNASIDKLKIELTRAELWDRFRPYVYAAKFVDDIRPKPEPDVFLHAAKEFEVDPANCIVVEDSVTGVTGGRAAGMRVIGFAGGSHTKEGHADRLTEAGAETVLKRLSDIPATIEAFELWDGMDA